MKAAAAAIALLLATVPARGDVILSAEALNDSLKTLQRHQRQVAQAGPADASQALFDLGVAADALASLLSDEVAAHGMQERQLLELALRRTRDIGVAIQWVIEKDRFFYDGAAFRAYLERVPDGPRAAEARFWIVETEFYRTSREDPAAIRAAIETKKAFLRRHPAFTLAPNVGVFLAIDYRDLSRYLADAGRRGEAARYARLAREQFARVARAHPGTDPGKIAAELLERMKAEAGARAGR